ncbi:hypothetical protein ACXYMU_06915 [Pontibacter sp. CAU 1760]
MKKWYYLYKQLLYLHFSKGFLNLPASAKNAASPQALWKRFGRVVGHTLLRLFGNLLKQVEHPDQLQGKVWLYAVSQNNVDSLRFVEQGIPEAVFVAGQGKDIGKYHHSIARLSLRRKLLYYYKLPYLLFQFLKHNRASTLRFFDLLYDAVGFYEVYSRKLQQYRPIAVVFANDHNADARAMLLAAKHAGIKTIYLQHASVSALFPPLAYDLNLLEGQDSLDKYHLCGQVHGKVELVGMPKADPFVPLRNKRQEIKTVGIGCNLMDNLQEVEALLKKLATFLPGIQLIVRPHPRDSRSFFFLHALGPQFQLSDGKKESTFEYLQRLDVQISGNSGIHLEAVLLNVWSVYYNFNHQEQLHDYYGFIKHGLIDEATSAESLCQTLQAHLTSKPTVYLRAHYFNATVGTDHDGNSSGLALQHIRGFLQSEN